jgi:uncharacterized protein (TIGR03118 family)
MQMNASPLKLCRLACASALLLAACGGGGGYSGSAFLPVTGTGMGGAAVTGTSFGVTNLVSDLPASNGSSNLDTHLVKAWGVAFNPRGFVWVSNNATSTSTLYDGNGVPQTLVVAIPPGASGNALPTGIVFNGNPGFTVTENGKSGSSAFIFAGEAGTLSGWSPAVNATNAIKIFDDGAAGTVYTGLALASQGSPNFLYAADFRHAKVDVFDTSFAKVTTAGNFTDSALPAGYAPFGIQAIGGQIYVSYAIQDGAARNAVPGAGLGLVNVFDTAGNLVRRLISPGNALNAPWGMALAPAEFGAGSNALLIANAGDGRINAFDRTTGALMQTLSAPDGTAITIDGLRGIAFGNDINNQPANTLFFAAGPAGGSHGVYGRIDKR